MEGKEEEEEEDPSDWGSDDDGSVPDPTPAVMQALAIASDEMDTSSTFCCGGEAALLEHFCIYVKTEVRALPLTNHACCVAAARHRTPMYECSQD